MTDFRTLTVTNIGEKKEENVTVTLSPADIRLMLVFNETPVTLQDQLYKKAVILFNDGFEFVAHLSDYDINLLETTIGGFGLPE